jgi:hypothetical protein
MAHQPKINPTATNHTDIIMMEAFLPFLGAVI